jgi:hypothetical protein
MKQLMHILFLIFGMISAFGQTDSSKVDSASRKNTEVIAWMAKPDNQVVKENGKAVIAQQSTKPQVFNSGFIDFQNSGQMNASARVFKLYIGEPGKFMLPLSVYSGVSGNNPHTNLSSGRGSEQMILGLINPMSGVFNISTENSFRFNKKATSLTGFSTVYQVGEKMISGQQALTLKSFSFFSTYANTGLLFQTGAWEKDKEKNMGVFWLLLRYHAIKISNSFEDISGYPPKKGFFTGYSVGVGIEINNVLNIKSYYYRYINPGASIFDIPIFQLTFNYSMKPSG